MTSSLDIKYDYAIPKSLFLDTYLVLSHLKPLGSYRTLLQKLFFTRTSAQQWQRPETTIVESLQIFFFLSKEIFSLLAPVNFFCRTTKVKKK